MPLINSVKIKGPMGTPDVTRRLPLASATAVRERGSTASLEGAASTKLEPAGILIYTLTCNKICQSFGDFVGIQENASLKI